MKKSLTLWCGLVLAAGLTGCGPPRKDPAIVAYEQFVAAVRQGRADAVWALLAPRSRDVLSQKLGLAPDAAVDAVRDRLAVRPGAELELDFPRKARIDTDLSSEDRHVVIAPLAGREVRLAVVRVGDEWRVDLFAPPGSADG
jgi:hypothetical protein